MSIKNFKFVSPGIFINEIDESFVTPAPPTIGPVVIGRAQKGLAMTPISVNNFQEFVDQFGDTVPGKGGGDVYRDGNNQSPMYGTYAAKAFLRSEVAPLTYIRLLGQQAANATGDGECGWATKGNPADSSARRGGGAYGLFVAHSGSITQNTDAGDSKLSGTGSFHLGAILYADEGAFLLSGSVMGTDDTGLTLVHTAALATYLNSDSNGNFKLKYTKIGATNPETENFSISFDDGSQNFIRKKINTNPTLLGSGSFYPETAEKDYWLGETYEQFLRDNLSSVAAPLIGIMLPLGSGSATAPTTGPMKMKGVSGGSQEAKAGWFISQDVGPAGEFQPEKQQKLFRLKGRGHGEWLHKNAKIQIDRIRGPISLEEEYGSFSVVIRALGDTDTNQQVLERYDNLSLDPTSPNFISKRIGDVYYEWDETNERLRRYGNYENVSRYVYVELNDDVEAGATNPSFVPFGFYLPPVYPSVQVTSSHSNAATTPSTAQTSLGPFITAKASSIVGGGMMPSSAVAASLTMGPVGAHGTITTGQSFVLVDAAGNSTKYRLDKTVAQSTNTDGYAGGAGTGVSINVGLAGSPDATAVRDAIINKINAMNAPKLYTAEASGTSILVTQTTAGTAGNKTVGSNSTPITIPNFGTTTAGVDAASSDSAISGGVGKDGRLLATYKFPSLPLVSKDTDAQVTNRDDAVFGMRSTRQATSTRPATGLGDLHRMLFAGQGDDPTTLGLATKAADGAATQMIDGYADIFTMDNLVQNTNDFTYTSGSRTDESSLTAQVGKDYRSLLDLGYDSFMAPFFGGFDGFDITVPDPLANTQIAAAGTKTTSYEFNTVRQALETVADPELLDFNVLAVPGLTHEGLTNYQMDLCQERRDALAVVDLPNVYTPFAEEYVADKTQRANRNVIGTVQNLRARRIDNSYACTFYPWVQTRDSANGQTLWVPPSVAMMGVFASSQAKADIWFAPAGFNRGGLSDGAAGIPILNASSRLSSKERDQLYEAHINPIASFPSTGIVVFGQKTLQMRPSALDRINVRRLVIFLKKQISILSTQILFEQNVQATWDRFKGLIEPFLSNVKTRYGLSEYKLVLDETTTTPDLIDQNILYAKIMIKPARAIEFIAIDFIIANTGASFDD